MVNAGDTVWVMLSTALVMLMTIPGLAFFYGGLVRRKNVLSILMQCFIIMCVVSLQWILFGYSLAFGPDTGYGIIGGSTGPVCGASALRPTAITPGRSPIRSS